jgi:hypothetical protein
VKVFRISSALGKISCKEMKDIRLA